MPEQLPSSSQAWSRWGLKAAAGMFTGQLAVPEQRSQRQQGRITTTDRLGTTGSWHSTTAFVCLALVGHSITSWGWSEGG